MLRLMIASNATVLPRLMRLRRQVIPHRKPDGVHRELEGRVHGRDPGVAGQALVAGEGPGLGGTWRG